ncbi:B12 binding protein [Terracoccus luteus]|uniref:B12 binding protein n=1 Tax=Terracoccus luteus TaxID=53356 RepID=A0A495XVU4_9MICO|nr:MerR family transcriptional regulator [Terracoccus luteus]RKT78700.1 B12 binding protein [Terracoccus luteus]
MSDNRAKPRPSADSLRAAGFDGVPAAMPELSWPVGAVSERLGIAAPTLRSWDRRHGVGPTHRTGGNHRRYSETDINRVTLMARLTAQGVPAQASADVIASMDDEAVERQLTASDGDPAGDVTAGADRTDPGSDGAGRSAGDGERDDTRAERRQARRGTGPGVAASTIVESIVSAAHQLDGPTLANLYRQTLRQREVGDAWTHVFAPSLRRIGDLWEGGRFGVESEHLASELLQSELRSVVRANRLRLAGPPVLLAGADEEHHHLPLVALEAELARHAVASLFFGPRMPTPALVEAMRRTTPPAVFLWASISRRRHEPFWTALDAVDWPMTVIVGGPGWPTDVRLDHDDIVLRQVDDFDAAVAALLEASGRTR